MVIDDLLEDDDPLLVELKICYGRENVILINESKQGLDYIIEHLSQKMIVILDLAFTPGELSGIHLVEELRKKTSLVYVIIWTARDLNAIPNDELIKFINNDVIAFVLKTTSTSDILKIVEKASHQLEVRVDAVLEEWISNQAPSVRSKIYLKMKDGREFTLDDILESIRHQTEIGKKMERNILQLAIDLIIRQKTKLDD